MTTVTVASQIEAPVQRVFDLFTDIEHGSAHVSGIRNVEMLTPGRFGLGTRWRETRELFGCKTSVEMEVTAFEKNRTYTITHHKAGVTGETVFRFEPSGNGTKVNLEFGLETSGMPPGLLAPVNWAIAGKVRDLINHDLIDLKKTAEAAAH